MLAEAGGGGSVGANLSFQGITTAVDSLVSASKEGFALSENGGQPLIDAIDSLKSEVAEAISKSQRLEAEPPLGTTPNAKVFKPFLATIASDPDQGAIPVMRKLLDDLNRAEAVIKQAMKNYAEADMDSATNITNAANGAGPVSSA
jgi:hypothetical protein